jgi:hypothetical protein
MISGNRSSFDLGRVCPRQGVPSQTCLRRVPAELCPRPAGSAEMRLIQSGDEPVEGRGLADAARAGYRVVSGRVAI